MNPFLRLYKAFRLGLSTFRREWRYFQVPEMERLRVAYLHLLWDPKHPKADNRAHWESAKRALRNYRLQLADAAKQQETLGTGPSWSVANPWIERYEKNGGDEAITEALDYVGRTEYTGDDEYFWADRCLKFNSDLREFVYIAWNSDRFLKETVPASVRNAIGFSEVGQFPYVPINGTKQDSLYNRYIYLLNRFIQHSGYKREDKFVWCELGSGYGRMAQVIRDYFPNATILLVDIPTTLLPASYVNGRHFSKLRLAFYEDIREKTVFTREDIAKYDVIFMPHFMFERLAPGTVDVLWNASSLAEMPRDTVINYFKLFDRVVRPGGIFFTSNWNEREGYPMVHPILDEFPWNRTDWDVKSYIRRDPNMDIFKTLPLPLGEVYCVRRDTPVK